MERDIIVLYIIAGVSFFLLPIQLYSFCNKTWKDSENEWNDCFHKINKSDE